MTDLPKPGRRRLLVSLAVLPAATRAGKLTAAPTQVVVAPPGTAVSFPESPELLVAGPEDGALNRWADALQPALEQALPPDTAIRRVEVGSIDGVTGANQFEVRSVPDGSSVLLVPGDAALAWMVGDPRAQFDVGHWVPVMAGTSAGIVVGRPGVLAPGAGARIAAANPGSFDLAALLGCYLLGARIQPAFGLMSRAVALASFSRREVDVVLLRGPHVPEQFSTFAAAGAQALFTLGAFDDTGQPTRDPLFPQVPHFAELYATRLASAPTGPLYAGWCAVAAATRLEFGLVLQHLTPAAMVALWRHAGTDAAASLGVQATCATLGVRPLAGSAATINANAAAAGAPALLELRRWLATRFNWQPA